MSVMYNTENFLGSPLVAWVQSFFSEKIQTNAQLVDGCLISDILTNIAPTVFTALRIQKNDVGDIITRAQNLAEILRSMKNFYQNKLLQLVVMKTPDVLNIARDPESECSIHEMQKVLLLLLGCAVQCDHKEDFIEAMKELDVDVQRGLVVYIQEITESPDHLISLRQNDMSELSHEELVSVSENLYYQVQKAIEQRDDFVETVLDLSLLQAETILDQDESSRKAHPLSPHTSFRSAGFLQASKQRFTELQSELDDRNMALCDLREEIAQLKLMLDNVRLENKQLVSEAGWAKTYRDEIDILKSQLDEANKLQFENGRLKEKVRELDFYKKRFDELKEQSELLYETKLVLEEQVAGSTSKITRYEHLEDENNRLSTQIRILMEERKEDHKRITELVDEVARLTVEKQNSLSENAIINAELDGLRLQRETESPSVPLLQEYNRASSTDLLRLEKENKHLTKLLENMKTPRSAADVNQDLLEKNKILEESNSEYKSLISKLTKALLGIGGLPVVTSLIIERDNTRELGGVIGKQSVNLKNLRGTLKKQSSELQELASELAKKGVEIDVSLLEEALAGAEGNHSNGVLHQGQKHNLQPQVVHLQNELDAKNRTLVEQTKEIKSLWENGVTMKSDLERKEAALVDLRVRLEESEALARKTEIQVAKRGKDVAELERRFEQVQNENKALEQNLTIQTDKVNALEERVGHLLSSASEDTRKVNLVLEVKLKQIRDQEARIGELQDQVYNQEKLQLNLKQKEDKIELLNTHARSVEEKLRHLEVECEKAKNNCMTLEHSVNLKNERIVALEASISEISTAASVHHGERVALLAKSLEVRDTEIAVLEAKFEELSRANNQLRSSSRAKEERLSELEEKLAVLQGTRVQTSEDKHQLLLQDMKSRNAEIEQLEIRLSDAVSSLSKSERLVKHKEEKIVSLEQRLSELEYLAHDKERLHNLLDERTRRALDLEERFDAVVSENSKLKSVMILRDNEYATAMQSLKTLENSICDQSSLSKLISIKDEKIAALQSTIDSKDQILAGLENQCADSESRARKLMHAVKIKEEKIEALEKSCERLEEVDEKNKKSLASLQQKEEKIRDLEDRLDQLNELTRLNSRLSDGLKQRDEKIVGLERRIDDLEDAVKMNERLNQQVQQKEEKLAMMLESIQDLESRLHNSEHLRDTIKKNAEQEIRRLSEQVDELSDHKIKRQMSLKRREQTIVNLESRIQEYTSERKLKDSRIQELQSRLEGTMSKYRTLDMSNEEKDQRILDLETRIAELQDTYKDNRKLLRALQKKEEELEGVKQKTDDLNASNKQYMETLAAKDRLVLDLQERLDETLSLNNRLDSNVKKQADKVEHLEHALNRTEEDLERLSSDKHARERQIERQAEKIEELLAQLTERGKELKELEKRLQSNQKETSEKSGLSKLLTEKETVISELHLRIKSLESSPVKQGGESGNMDALGQLEDLQKKVKVLEREKHKARLDLQEKEGEILDLEKKIEELGLTGSDSDKWSAILKEKNSQISILRQNLEEFQDSIVKLETRVDEMTTENARSAAALKQQEERIKALKEQLEDYVSRNHTLSTDLQMKDDKLSSLTKSLDDANCRIKELEEEISSLERDLNDMKNSGSLKNITQITERIQLTKRARSELYIKRSPPKIHQVQMTIPATPSRSSFPPDSASEEMDKLLTEISLLEKQKTNLTLQIESMAADNASLRDENESLGSEMSLLKSDYKTIQEEMADAKEQFRELDISATKIAHRCEVLVQLNATLEEENKALMDQVNKLLTQNQGLLAQTLQSRDQFLEDERTFSDHIYGLEREKEMLSDKVLAAERALQENAAKKKSALWRGTHKVLKMAGLAKKKDSTSRSPDHGSNVSDYALSPQAPGRRPFSSTSSVTSPLGPIRGLLSRSRQDLSSTEDVSSYYDGVVLRQHRRPLEYSESSGSEVSNRYSDVKARPKSEFFGAKSFSEENPSPVVERKAAGRTKSMDMSFVHTFSEDNYPTAPGGRVQGGDVKGDDAVAIEPVPRKTSSLSSASHKSFNEENTPSSDRASSTNAPIQKVTVKQSVTPQVMKTEPVNDAAFINRLHLDEPPHSSRRNTSGSYSSPPPDYPSEYTMAGQSTSTPLPQSMSGSKQKRSTFFVPSPADEAADRPAMMADSVDVEPPVVYYLSPDVHPDIPPVRPTRTKTGVHKSEENRRKTIGAIMQSYDGPPESRAMISSPLEGRSVLSPTPESRSALSPPETRSVLSPPEPRSVLSPPPESRSHVSPAPESRSILPPVPEPRPVTSPPVGANPFGSREQRASFRRYEIEEMEPRPLSKISKAPGAGVEASGSVDGIPSSPVDPRRSSREAFGGKEARASDRPAQRPPLPSATAMKPSEARGSLRKNDAKKNPTWFEYGNV